MGATKLRYAADGPFVQNAEGGAATPGNGFQTRRLSVPITGLAALSTSLNTGALFTASWLPDIDLNKRYHVDLVLHAQKTDAWTATGTVAWTFQYSADAGSTWTTFHTSTFTYGGEAAHDMTENVTETIKSTPLLASTFTGVEQGDDLIFRVRAVLSGGEDNAFSFAGMAPQGILDIVEEL